MPFTVTHLIAIAPLKKIPWVRLLPLSALAVGSMVPDIPMFFAFTGEHIVTHSISGLFTHCLPIGLIFYLLFQLLVRDALLAIMPPGIKNQLGERQEHTPLYVAGVAIAILIGSAIHVFWDSFTDLWGWGTAQIPALRGKVDLLGHEFAGYRLVQHGSTVLFLPVLIYIFLKAALSEPLKFSKTTVTDNVFSRHPVLTIMAVFVAPAIAALIQGAIEYDSLWLGGLNFAARRFGTYLVTTTIVYAVIFQLIRLRSSQEGQGNKQSAP